MRSEKQMTRFYTDDFYVMVIGNTPTKNFAT